MCVGVGWGRGGGYGTQQPRHGSGKQFREKPETGADAKKKLQKGTEKDKDEGGALGKFEGVSHS